ncbi:MAG TPA: hypothetical protein VJ935_05625 [Acidimicrobiia bacterium]|nr:hypothetical protein [Acidimicrobiia bacterium]
MKHLMENIRGSRIAVIGLGVLISVIAFAPIALSRPGLESSLALTIPGLDDADDCKQGGWRTYNVFKNQGDCVSYVVTGGRNLPSGTNASTTTTFAVTTTAAPTTTTTTLATTTTTLASTTTTTLIAGLTSKDQCKNGGWVTFGVFRNQGDCVSFVTTGGSNPPDGP